MFAESIRITLVALFFFWMCKEGVLVDGMSFETLLGAVITTFLPNFLGRCFCIIRDITYFQIIRPNLLNYRLRELPICTKICTKASSFVLLPFCFGSAFIS
jgi:hypothetical protein